MAITANARHPLSLMKKHIITDHSQDRQGCETVTRSSSVLSVSQSRRMEGGGRKGNTEKPEVKEKGQSDSNKKAIEKEKGNKWKCSNLAHRL